jgi:phosphoserine phosphatase
MKSRFASVALDVDSTVSGVEGIDWLARRRGAVVAARIVALTDRAMRGEIPLESIYGARLAEIRPSRHDVEALSRAYIAQIAPDCERVIAELRSAGVRVVLISGGVRPGIQPLAERLRVSDGDLHAVDLRFDESGAYAGYDERSPLTTSAGKHGVLVALGLPRPILAAGDGSTDVAMRGAADTFAAYTGFAAREPVVAQADVVLSSFAELGSFVMEA